MAKNYSIKNCPYCKKSFQKNHPNQIYCSLDCRFLDRVTITPHNQCWIWKGAFFSQGYALININGKPFGAHRISWQLFCSPIPKGSQLCHHCDNKGCVNPKHLFLGTQKDNIDDMVKKERWNGNKGETHHCSKLKIKDIKEIRKLYSIGTIQKDIAKKFNIFQSSVSKIVNKKAWRHI